MAIAPAFAAGEQPVLASKRHHAVILPMAARRVRSLSLPFAAVSIRRAPFWRSYPPMLKPVDPHDGSEGIDGSASAVGLVGVVHADFGGFGEWSERRGVLPAAGMVIRDVHGVAGSTES